jgi:hypothetical protein
MKSQIHSIVKLFLLTISFNGLHLEIHAQLSYTSAGGASSLMIGGIRSALSGANGMYGNTATITSVNKWSVDIGYERKFNIAELSQFSLAGVLHSKYGAIGIIASHFGYGDYNEQKIGVGYGRKLSSSIAIGGQFDYLSIFVRNQGSKGFATMDIGLTYKISKTLKVGSHIFNPFNTGWSDESDVGTRFRSSLTYTPSDKVDLIVELDKIVFNPLALKFGIVYHPMTNIDIAAGINPSLGIYSFGAAYVIKSNYKISGAFASHNQLGGTSAVSFNYHK